MNVPRIYIYLLMFVFLRLKITILWLFFRDGKEIKSTTKTKISEDGNLCLLKTDKFTKSDAGLYKCVATNPAGTAECEATVSLYG